MAMGYFHGPDGEMWFGSLPTVEEVEHFHTPVKQYESTTQTAEEAKVAVTGLSLAQRLRSAYRALKGEQ
jgi:hypothetical protein